MVKLLGTALRVLGYAFAAVFVVSALVALVALVHKQFWIVILALGVAAPIALGLGRALKRRIPAGVIIELDLQAGVTETQANDPLGRLVGRDIAVLRDVIDALDRAADDRRVKALVARIDTAPIGLAQIQELRDAIHRFRASGKPAIAYADTFGEGQNGLVPYYLAAAFSEIHLQPTGQVSTSGLLAESWFVKGLLDKLGIKPELDHRNEYKAFLYRFTQTGFTEPHREVITTLLNEQYEQIVTGIAGDRKLDAADVRAALEAGPLFADAAQQRGLIDHLSYRDKVMKLLDGPRLYAGHYLARAGRKHRRGAAIALIHGIGGITRGKSRTGLLPAQPMMGADDVAAAFRAAIKDDSIKAIVFRIDSPGGSVIASDMIWRETVRAKEAGKPVIASMGNVAGSGGYYVAMNADKIVAQPATLTGSIGVIAGKLVTSEGLGKLGVTHDAIAIGEDATFFSPNHEYTEAGRCKRDAFLDQVYEQFVTKVAAGRGLSLDAVQAVAGGRVWTGKHAVEHGLVDELGGLARALELARQAANVKRAHLVPYPAKSAWSELGRRPENSDAFAELVARGLRAMAHSTSPAAMRGLQADHILRMPDVPGAR